ncbi:hypothetical protein [Streptomyces sp. LUP47B]|uniref:hypothetical protein n=1 Tax=Streptomyces sp. LUP47B TaxID=1890286 RepID=UPI0008519627|nr:hypothetical protein [Streptomyces sp. LUP47B]
MKHRTETTPPRLTADQLRQLIAAEKAGVRPPCFLCGEPVLDQKFLLGTEDENDRLLVNSPCLHAMAYGAELAVQVEAQMRMEAATEATEPVDTCRPVVVDGETIRVRGTGELSPEGQEALAALVRVAKTTFEAEAPEMVGELQNRLRLAHQARRAKAHQLDEIRRALCDAGFMEDDDPYSHADLADVVRQAGELVGPLLAEVKAARKFAAEMRDFCSPHGVSVDYADQLEAAMDRAKRRAA